MRIKVNYQINEKFILKKNRAVLLADSDLNEQNRNFERKIYKQEIQELNKRLEDLTQAIEMLKTPNSWLTQKSIKKIRDEFYTKPPKKNYRTNKTDVYHNDNIWSWDILDLIDYGPEIILNYRYVLVIIDNFSKLGWTVPLKNKNARTIKGSFESLISSKSKPHLIQTDGGKEFYKIIYQNFLINNNIKHYSKNRSLGAVFAEKISRTIKDDLEKVVFEKVILIGSIYYPQ